MSSTWRWTSFLSQSKHGVCLSVTDIRGLRPGQWDERAFVRPSVFLSFFLSLCLSVRPSVSPYVHSSVLLSIRPSFCH